MTGTPTQKASLLDHLADRFHLAPENVATAALQSVLRSSRVTAGGLETYLRALTPGLAGGLSYLEQFAGDGGGIPDVAGVAENGNTPVLIEAKFDASLTEHQPVTYLGQLPAGQPAALLFVVPSRRVERLWPEILNRARVAGLSAVEQSAGADLRHARIGRHVLALTSWRALLETLRAAAVADADGRAAADLDQLAALAESRDARAFRPLQAEELCRPLPPGRMEDLSNLIDQAVDRLVATHVATTSAMGFQNLVRAQARDGSWRGRWFGLQDVAVFLRVRARPEPGERLTPLWLWIGLNSRPSKAAVASALAPLASEDCRLVSRRNPTRIEVAIDVPVDSEAADVVAAIAGQLMGVAPLLAALTPSPS